jgi:type IV pilus secretin PilQ/predicted competence protein
MSRYCVPAGPGRTGEGPRGTTAGVGRVGMVWRPLGRAGVRCLLAFGIAVAAAAMATTGDVSARSATTTPSAALTRISSTLEARAGILAIEATAPVPYVASQTDPRTVVVELRDVVATGFADEFTVDPRHPVGAVQVESAQAFDGATVARVRITLRHSGRPRVRSSRNMIFVEADRVDATPTTPGMLSLAGPSAVIRDVHVTQRGTATAVTLLGTSRLVATSVHEPKDGPRRLVIDLPNVTSAVAAATAVRQGPVDRVRIGFDPEAPLMTQVTVDLSRTSPYRLESSPDGNDLTVVFDEPVTDPVAAMRLPAAAPALEVITPGGVTTGTATAPPAAPRGVAPALAQAAAPPPVAPQAPPPPAAPGQAPRFTGFPISLDFQDVDLRAVLRTFSEISGLNIVIDPTIQGTVNVNLRDVPWDQALDIILKANRLGYVADGTVIRIAPLTVLADEEAQRRKLAEEQALSGELGILTRSLSYARAADLTALLTATILSSRGDVQIDPRTNTLIIRDLPDRLQGAADLITTLDRPEPQVEIEARIVTTSRDFARQVGVRWGFNGRAAPELGNTLPTAFPNQGSIGGRLGSTSGTGADVVNNVVNLGVDAATSGIGLALGSINGAVNLDVALSALEESGQGRILSTPRVSTQNNVEAEIMQGLQIPIQTIANNTVTVTFREAALVLRVTPQITAANTVIMRIVVDNSAADFSRAVGGIPPIDTQRANTQVLVANGETTVIGGIYVSREQASQDRTPGLHRLPLLGWLFKRNEFSDESRELLIFITPKIQRL